MWHKVIWNGHPMKLEFIRLVLLVELATRSAQLSSQSGQSKEQSS